MPSADYKGVTQFGSSFERYFIVLQLISAFMQLEPSFISVFSFFKASSLHTSEQAKKLFAAVEKK
jgi:hypothetical protein